MNDKEIYRTNLEKSLAAYAHEAWSGWMKYLFLKGHKDENGNFVILKDSVDRWTRQMNTHFKDLPEDEQLSDFDEASKILDIVDLNSEDVISRKRLKDIEENNRRYLAQRARRGLV